mgnify:CR=1 FL=1
MNITKALLVSIIILLLIFGIQMFVNNYTVFGFTFLDPMSVNLLNCVSVLLGVGMLATWGYLYHSSVKRNGGKTPAAPPTIGPDETTGWEGGSTPTLGPDDVPASPGVPTAEVMDVIRLIIELSDGRTRKVRTMRVDGAHGRSESIGSSSNCSIHIEDSTVAPHHADLRINAGIIKLYNVGHNNGVSIGRAKVAPRTEAVVSRGSTVVLGGVTITIS